MIYKVTMKGFLFILLTYFLVILFCASVKYMLLLIKKNKKGESKIAQKIYYIQNKTPRVKKSKKVTPNIALKGTIVEKEGNLKEFPFIDE